MKYQKKPVVIDAIQFTGKNHDEIVDFVKPVQLSIGERFGEVSSLVIPTAEGKMEARQFDWIIKGIKGEFYPCKPDIFEATYEKV